jgi:hypothetical protein
LGTSRSTRPSVTRLWRLIASKASGRIKSPHYPCFDVRLGSQAEQSGAERQAAHHYVGAASVNKMSQHLQRNLQTVGASSIAE